MDVIPFVAYISVIMGGKDGPISNKHHDSQLVGAD